MIIKINKTINGLNISVAMMVGGSLFMYPGLSALAGVAESGAEWPFKSTLAIVSLFSFSCGSYMYWKNKKNLIIHCSSLDYSNGPSK